VDWLAVIEVHHLLIRSDVDTTEPCAKAPHPASGGRLILATCSPAAAKARQDLISRPPITCAVIKVSKLPKLEHQMQKPHIL